MRTPTILTTALLLVTLWAIPSSAAADRPVVLVVNSYHAGYPWVMSHNEALRRNLSDIADLVFHDMDTKRLNPAHHLDRAALALDKYREVQPDLVILADDNALAFLGPDITRAGTPVVYLGINANPRIYACDNDLLTGVLERPLLKRSIIFIHDILGPSMNKCMILFDNGTTAKVTMDTIFKGNSRIMVGTVQTDIVLATTMEQWKQQVLTAGELGYGAIILGLYQTLTDNEGKHVPDDVVARWTGANSPVPVFAFWDFAVGRDKAVGGLVLAGRPQGEEAAGLARRILDGEDPKKIQPVTAEHGRFLFSRSGLERWHIDLPPSLAQPGEVLEFIE
jgi:ABC-type uncharacterized transport system substrate-binding protein